MNLDIVDGWTDEQLTDLLERTEAELDLSEGITTDGALTIRDSVILFRLSSNMRILLEIIFSSETNDCRSVVTHTCLFRSMQITYFIQK